MYSSVIGFSDWISNRLRRKKSASLSSYRTVTVKPLSLFTSVNAAPDPAAPSSLYCSAFVQIKSDVERTSSPSTNCVPFETRSLNSAAFSGLHAVWSWELRVASCEEEQSSDCEQRPTARRFSIRVVRKTPSETVIVRLKNALESVIDRLSAAKVRFKAKMTVIATARKVNRFMSVGWD